MGGQARQRQGWQGGDATVAAMPACLPLAVFPHPPSWLASARQPSAVAQQLAAPCADMRCSSPPLSLQEIVNEQQPCAGQAKAFADCMGWSNGALREGRRRLLCGRFEALSGRRLVELLPCRPACPPCLGYLQRRRHHGRSVFQCSALCCRPPCLPPLASYCRRYGRLPGLL